MTGGFVLFARVYITKNEFDLSIQRINKRITSLQKINEKNQRNLSSKIDNCRQQLQMLKNRISALEEKVTYGKIVIGDNRNKEDQSVILYDEIRQCISKINTIEHDMMIFSKQLKALNEDNKKVLLENDHNKDKLLQTCENHIQKIKTELIDIHNKFFKEAKLSANRLDYIETIINRIPTSSVNYNHVLDKINNLQSVVQNLVTQFSKGTVSTKIEDLKSKIQFIIEEFGNKDILIKDLDENIHNKKTNYRVVNVNNKDQTLIFQENNNSDDSTDITDSNDSNGNSNNSSLFSSKRRSQIEF